MHKGFSMGKKYIFALLLTGSAANLFGAACSSAQQELSSDYGKLRSLARANGEFVIDLVENLKKDSKTNSLKPRSLIIFGSPRNGKKSLAREIADQSGRTRDDHRIRSISGLQQFVEDQARRESPHVSFLKNVHIFQEASALEDCMDDLRENEQVFLIAVADNSFKRNEALRLFDFEIELNDPDLRARRQILEFCLARKPVSDALLGYFAAETERLSSGKLHVLSDQLLGVEGRGLTREQFDELIVHIARVPLKPGVSWREWTYRNKNGFIDVVCLISTIAWMHYSSSEDKKETLEYKNEVVRMVLAILGTGLKIGLNNL